MRLLPTTFAPEAYGLAAGALGGAVTALAAGVGLTEWAAVVPVGLVVAAIVATGTRARRGEQERARRRDRTTAARHAELATRLDAIEVIARDAQGAASFSAMDVPYPLPLGGFAIDPETAAILARTVATTRPGVVVELGSGASTAVIGLQLARLGHGHLFSLEHDPEYAAKTLEHIEALGLGDVVTVLDSPLADIRLGDESYRWYQVPPAVAALPRIDLLLIDGPPQYVDPGGTPRYPALPMFGAQLGPGSRVLVDDAAREGERRALARWKADRADIAVEMVKTHHGLAILRFAETD